MEKVNKIGKGDETGGGLSRQGNVNRPEYQQDRGCGWKEAIKRNRQEI